MSIIIGVCVCVWSWNLLDCITSPPNSISALLTQGRGKEIIWPNLNLKLIKLYFHTRRSLITRVNLHPLIFGRDHPLDGGKLPSLLCLPLKHQALHQLNENLKQSVAKRREDADILPSITLMLFLLTKRSWKTGTDLSPLTDRLDDRAWRKLLIDCTSG